MRRAERKNTKRKMVSQRKLVLQQFEDLRIKVICIQCYLIDLGFQEKSVDPIDLKLEELLEVLKNYRCMKGKMKSSVIGTNDEIIQFQLEEFEETYSEVRADIQKIRAKLLGIPEMEEILDDFTEEPLDDDDLTINFCDPPMKQIMSRKTFDMERQDPVEVPKIPESLKTDACRLQISDQSVQPPPPVVSPESQARTREIQQCGGSDRGFYQNQAREMVKQEQQEGRARFHDRPRRRSPQRPSGLPACRLCQQDHGITRCPIFLKQSIQQRVNFCRELNLCQLCLRRHSSIKPCFAKQSCYECEKMGKFHCKHHPLLHFTSRDRDEYTRLNQRKEKY